MTTPLYAALFFTVALMVTTAYFLMSSVPLLILKHDTPVDARFVRGFFNTYYLASMFTATGTALSYAFAGRVAFAIGAAALAIMAFVLRGNIISKMDLLRARIESDQMRAIPEFRKTHLAAIVITLVQLVVIVSSLTTLSI